MISRVKTSVHLSLAAAILLVSGVSITAAEPAPIAGNPLMVRSALPFQAPPFDKIKDADFAPALEAGMEQQLTEVDKIANDPEPPTFDNTIAALERSGQLLTRAAQSFALITGANTNDALEKLQEQEAPKLQATQDAILLNAKLFKRIETLYRRRSKLELSADAQRLLWYYYTEAALAGAQLSTADQARLRALNQEEASLSAKFTNQLLAADKDGALIVSDSKVLAGLTQAALDAAAQAAAARNLSGKWVIPLQNTTQQPDLAQLSNRNTRELLFQASWTRAERGDANDTRAIVVRLAELRAQKAQILGYPDYAAWRLRDQMAQTPEAVNTMFAQLVPPVTALARKEAARIQAVIDRQPQPFTLQPWDWNFYAEQVRKAEYDLEDSEIRPYFELNRVLQDGLFYAATQLYGVTFKERKDLPVYHPDVRVFEVFNPDGSPLGLCYFDYFKRDNKSGGAWTADLVARSQLLGQQPVIYNVANFTKPAAGDPALLSFDDVITMFHEFGHALHALFTDEVNPTLFSNGFARDFVEFPSQFNERWALHPDVLAHYALHYRTGAPMPQQLVERIKKAATFNKGYDFTELLAASELDMHWHQQSVGATARDPDAFDTEVLEQTALNLPAVPPRYRSNYFAHIWAGGYAAGYYSYTWDKVLADDAFSWFQEHGGLTRANGQRFRELILAPGTWADHAQLFHEFRGRDPSIEPMLREIGLARSAPPSTRAAPSHDAKTQR
jgi:peptidyl-dipeptidase Dcp